MIPNPGQATPALRQACAPATIAGPSSRYSPAITVTGPARWMHVSGQLGIAPDGSLPPDGAGQIEQGWANLAAILAEAGMTFGDLVKITAFLTDPADVGAFRTIRDRYLEQVTPPPASTLLIVAGLAGPDFRFELEAIAATPL